MYSAYKLNKQDNNIQPWCTLFPIWNQSIVPCLDLTVASWQEAGKMVWYSHLFKNFPEFVVIHSIKVFGVINKAEVDVYLELSWFFCDPVDVGNLISGSSAFSTSSLYIWKFLVHKLLKPQSVQFSCSVISNSLQPHGLQHVRLPCPSPTSGVYSISCPLSRWWHPTVSSSVVPFSSCFQSFPALGSFQMSQFFVSGGQSIGVSASTSVLPMNIQDWFP